MTVFHAIAAVLLGFLLGQILRVADRHLAGSAYREWAYALATLAIVIHVAAIAVWMVQK